MLEVGKEPLIQSGGQYSFTDLKPDERKISPDVIILTNCVKYRNYHCRVSRTLLIDATEDQKKAYQTLYACFLQCVTQIIPGSPINKIYNKAVEYLKATDESMISKLSKSLGTGIGCIFEEKSLEITAENQNTIEPGMIFELRIGFTGMSNSKMNYSMLISDIISVTGDGKNREILTGAINKTYKDISYSMDEENPVEEQKQNNKKNNTGREESKRFSIKKENHLNVIHAEINEIWQQERKLRMKDNPINLEKEAGRKKHQEELRDKKILELQERFDSNDIQISKKANKLQSLVDICSYESPSQFPSDAKVDGICVDAKKESVLIPLCGRLIPFHISTIKNVSADESKDCFALRINFHVPGNATFNTPLGFPEPSGENFAYLKEISIRSKDSKNLANVSRLIKELIKRNKAQTQQKKDKEDLAKQETIIILKGKHPVLNDVSIRPNISGKKTTGTLDAHTNGLRFTSSKNEKIDIIYSNIKHAFYQSCENELIVLVHFNLYNPIMNGNKKTKDVQFYSEVGLAADDLDSRRRNANDMDQLEQENRERQLRAKMNGEFKRFADQVEGIAKIEFDAPYRELGFFGVPQRSNVRLLPTVNCLVNLTEVPFFVVSLSDIEVVHFERVNVMNNFKYF